MYLIGSIDMKLVHSRSNKVNSSFRRFNGTYQGIQRDLSYGELLRKTGKMLSCSFTTIHINLKTNSPIYTEAYIPRHP